MDIEVSLKINLIGDKNVLVGGFKPFDRQSYHKQKL
jgi:hypothetical protein